MPAKEMPAKNMRGLGMLTAGWLGLSLIWTPAIALAMTLAVTLVATPAAAQQNEPVNLLSITPTPGTDTPISIDQAIDQAVDQAVNAEGLDQRKGAKQPSDAGDGSNLAMSPNNASSSDLNKGDAKPAIIGRADADNGKLRDLIPDQSEQENDALNRAQNEATDDLKTDMPAAVRETDPSPNSDLSVVNDPYGSAKIGRRKISDVGLAAIGVGDTGNRQLDSLIWRGTSARDAVFLLQKAAVVSHSQVISGLAYEVVARQSIPPSGANNVAADLVEARLAFLANGGRSGDLALLVSQLPEADKWADWRRWLTEHYLMVRDDVAACEIVSRQVTQTMDPFWHKSNVICQAVQGNVGGARFGADILAANGVDDPIFFGLVDEVLNKSPANVIDPAKLDSAHIVLMDVANRPIPLEGLAVLPKQMAETIMKLKFLGPDARMVSTYDGLRRGLITHRQAGKLWRNAGQGADDAQLALARLDERADALTTALAWRALDADTRSDRLALVAKAFKAEIAAGNGAVLLPLYAELVRNALADEAVAANMRFDDLDVAPKMAFMLAINQPRDTSTLTAFAGNGDALKVAELLRGLSDGAVDAAAIGGLKLWHMLPVLEATGVAIEDQAWLDLVKGEPEPKQAFIGLPPLLLKAVMAAAESRHVAETILLAQWLLHDLPLDKVNPADLAAVIRALDMIGQNEVAKGFAQEIVVAHLLQRLAAMVPDGTQS